MNFVEKIRKLENNKFLSLGILIYIFIWWLLSFVTHGNIVVLEYIGQISVALIATIALLCFEDTFIALQIFVLFPFMLPNAITFYTVPIGLIGSIVLFVGGLIGHIVIYKPKIAKMKFAIGLLAFGLTFGLGGLSVDYDLKVFKMLILFTIGLAIVFAYGFFTSTTKKKFNELTEIVNQIGVLVILQVVVFYIMNSHVFLAEKVINIGWAGNSNTLGMILLCIFPFTIYSALKSEKAKAIILYVISFLEILLLIISYSRGAIISACVCFVALMIVFICLKEYRKKILLFISGSLLAISIFIGIVAIIDVELLSKAYGHLTKINLDSMNGRTPIYEMMIAAINEKPVFGYGLLYGFINPEQYLWGHNTFLHTTYSLGFVGLIAILWHHAEKYFYCIKNITLEKTIVLISFLVSDAYGFIDVNYFLPNFMIVLILSLIMIDSIYKSKENELDMT